jgi:hypothetical protein
MTGPRICAYPPCSEMFAPVDPKQRFCQSLCRTRQWKAERAYGPQRAVRTGKRRPSGLQQSHPRTVAEFAADYQETFGLTLTAARMHAERVAARALPARQRARLEGKR